MYQSMMTFLYVHDMEKAVDFVENALECHAVFEPSWAKVYQVANGAYLGIVDQSEGSVKESYQGGTLVSLTVESVDSYYERIKAYGVHELSDIKTFEDIGVRSFFFKGPEGYDFEIQSFIKDDVKNLFTKSV